MKMNKIGMSLLSVVALLALVACGKSGSTQERDEEAQSQFATNIEERASNTSINEENKKSMRHELVKLPYATNALEPVISQQTIELHHGKHLNGYVTNLNKMIEGTEFADMDLVDIVKKSEGGLFNQAGQTLNHNLYFTQFSPKGGGKPTGKLLAAIEKKYGSFEDFQKQFEADATALFGAGWAWLACDKDGNLQITKETNAGNPVTHGLIPLLGADVWEHAYYLDYQNRRAEHLQKLWEIIDWNVVGERYDNR